VNEGQFGWGIEMAKAKNIGFVKEAFLSPFGSILTAPLFMLMLLLNRRSRRKRESQRITLNK
jgi:hypothetical protein